MAKRRRYIKRNAIDYILLAVAILLALSLLFRGIGLYLNEHEDRRCTANIAFTVRGVDYDTMRLLQASDTGSFRFTDSSLALRNVLYAGTRKSIDIVEGENGEFEEVELSDRYDVSFTVWNIEGLRARDGGFLLGGVRRLATGDKAELITDDAKYLVSFSLVRIS